MKKFIYDFTKDELEKVIKPKFRVKQIYNWLYTKYVTEFNQMKNISKQLIDMLDEEYSLKNMRIIRKEISQDIKTGCLLRELFHQAPYHPKIFPKPYEAPSQRFGNLFYIG